MGILGPSAKERTLMPNLKAGSLELSRSTIYSSVGILSSYVQLFTSYEPGVMVLAPSR